MGVRKLWGGRFRKETDPLVEEFTQSIGYDYRLAKYDILGSLVHIQVLKESGFLSEEEHKNLERALEEIYQEVEGGRFEYDLTSEDIHTEIQRRVEDKVGALSLKLHTARSRNEQIAFDLKLFCLSELGEVISLCKKFRKVLREVGERNKDIVFPGYTHLQRAQPVHLFDYLNAYARMLKRDEERLEDAKARIKVSLGAGALAGTPIRDDLYPKAIKEYLSRYSLMEEDEDISKHIEEEINPLDVVSDRDFVIEILSGLAIVGMHLSRLAEDLIIYTSKEFGFVEIDDSFATGSSLMPQKKNPDVLELIRGYTGRLYGNLLSLLTTMKGLPLSYNRDMQLDKQPLFESLQIIKNELTLFPKLMDTLKWDKERIEKAIEDESLYATDLVYYLVRKGVPFREAHNIIGNLMLFCSENRKKIREMSSKELKRFSEKLNQKEVFAILTSKSRLLSKNFSGGEEG